MNLALSPAWLNPVLLIVLPTLIIAWQLLNEWQAAPNRRPAAELAIKPAAVPEDYFRIGPYIADRAHEKVLAWLRRSDSVPLYLTGDSGSSKSSLLNAFIIPQLRTDGWTDGR